MLDGIFNGSSVALVTPFKNDKIDYDALGKLIELQIAGGTDVLVPAGTTGEASTLSHTEQIELIEFTVKASAGRAKVMAGTGANATAEAIALTQDAENVGADGTLQVSPYYVKPSDEGTYLHFKAVAEATALPVVLYNVPGRTGKEISINTVARLSEIDNIIAVKEAGGDVSRVTSTLAACDITVLSGDDGLTLPMMVMGAKGIISVLANVAPAKVKELVVAINANDIALARELHNKMVPMVEAIFAENNPAGIKTALELAGVFPFEARLPVCQIHPETREMLKASMQTYGIL